MTSAGTIRPIKAGFAAVLALMIFALPAAAADPIFPPGSRVGLVPPAGMVVSKTFEGFEDLDNNAVITVTMLPPEAYAELDKAAADGLKKQGINVEGREPIDLSVGKGFLVVGSKDADKTRYRKWFLVVAAENFTVLVAVQIPESAKAYPDSVVRATLATLAVRAKVPDDELLGLLPFTVGDLAGFHIDDVIPGRVLMLTDLSNDHEPEAAGRMINARMMVAAEAGGPAEMSDYANFARMTFDAIGGITDVKITMSEPLRIGGQQGYQTMAQAKDARSGTDVMVVQWLRFGTSGFLHMIGMSRADIWIEELTRLRAVRDSVEPR